MYLSFFFSAASQPATTTTTTTAHYSAQPAYPIQTFPTGAYPPQQFQQQYPQPTQFTQEHFQYPPPNTGYPPPQPPYPPAGGGYQGAYPPPPPGNPPPYPINDQPPYNPSFQWFGGSQQKCSITKVSILFRWPGANVINSRYFFVFATMHHTILDKEFKCIHQ